MISIGPYRAAQFDGVRRLWEEAFPDDPPHNRAEVAVPEKLAFQPDLLLVATEGLDVVGTAMAGYDGHRGWLYSVAVSRARRRTGLGSQLVHAAEAALRELGCRKINLQVRTTNEQVVAFYRALGYEIEDRISMRRRI